ncbi:flippase activity-associated protein Agl23 [Halogranum rubrum]|uniref:Glycosyltransferase RgtA/B/C/D-like domain-containing protein n=1 Tax=Halogranum salarium B-1 TaxID=1210908 RepID=J3EY60_9EURY|nr:flippase activity-associated protein Agl23 [Halogranum salarium]EJN60192.1 hypothetical protein HSB1_07950 [Halogranum salarium B-1]
MSTDDRVGPRSANRTLLAVFAITALALVARLVGLGTRVMHWDEGRVGYWILRYHETGEFAYRPIIHGPFLPIVNDYVFTVLPPSDFSARLVVAVVGGLLPLTALLFWTRLRNSETVALALFLAVNPLFVYYSRFMRNDVLVAAFSFAALGFVVAAYDRRDLKYLYPAGVALALGLTAKENGLIYIVCYLGGAFVLFDHRLLRAAQADRPLKQTARGYLVSTKTGLSSWAGDVKSGVFWVVAHSAGAVAAFFLVIVFFYAPRPDLWQMFGDVSMAPDVLEQATVGAWEKFYGQWASGSHQSHDYLPFLFDILETIVYGSGVLVVFSLLGFVVDGYSSGRSRDLVAFAAYWAVASVIGYPVATDIQAPWAAIHVVLPLTIPAAIGGGYIYRTARQSVAIEDAIGTGIAALVILSAVVGVAGANVAYVDSTSENDKQVLQWAQPNNDLKDTLQQMGRIAETNEGHDVLFYGTKHPSSGETLFYVQDESDVLAHWQVSNWHSRLPLPWYTEMYGANVTSTPPNVTATEMAQDAPPVVIAYDWNRSELEDALPGYTVHEHKFKLWNENIVVFIDEEDYVNEQRADLRRAEPASTKRVRNAPVV